MWAILGLIAAALGGWWFGLAGLAAAVAAIWLIGLGWFAANGAFTSADPDSARAWAVGGGVALVLLGYLLVLRRLRRAAAAVTGLELDPEPAPPEPAPFAEPAKPAAADPSTPLSDAELDRYARHIVLRELGGAGQRRLRGARVLVVGAGGLGAPLLQYLAAAGVGRITLADDDTVSLSNLQRQIIFTTTDIGRPKAEAAADAIARLNPHVAVIPLTRRITAEDAALIGEHDLVLDGTDSFASRAAVNAACVAAGVPLLAGSIAQWEGQIALYDPARGGPCLACLFPEPPAAGLALSCAEAGVVGALPGVIGSMMALEVIKELGGVVAQGAGAGLRGHMVIFDGMWGDTRRIRIDARPACAVCGGKGADA